MLVNKLSSKVELWRKTERLNELGEPTYSYSLLKRIWANIIPQRGVEVTAEGNSSYGEISHKITIRVNSVDKINISDYFVYKTQIFDVKYFNYNYSLKDRIEIFCKVREEA